MNRILFVLLGIFALSGCLSSKTYVDPSFGKATYSDIKPVATKYDTDVAVEFQRNGKPLAAADAEVMGHVERTLRASGIINPTHTGSKPSLIVTINNIADLGDAATQGFGTGLTFGAIGSMVTDYYEATITYTDANDEQITKTYKHALHTTIGNKAAPFDGVQPTTAAGGFAAVVEQVLLNFIADMQSNGKLTLLPKINDYQA